MDWLGWVHWSSIPTNLYNFVILEKEKK